MENRRGCCLAGVALGVFVGVCGAQTPRKSQTFPRGIILIGVQRRDDPGACTIEVVSPTGEQARPIFRRDAGSILPGARLSRQGDRLAFCYQSNQGESELLVLDSEGATTKIIDDVGFVTAWSPDGKKLGFYRSHHDAHVTESFVIDPATGKNKKIPLGADYAAEDWHPFENTRTVIYMNPRNRMYREQKGDSYPARQLDLLTDEGKKTPVTKNPSSDNIWSRFSPMGKRMAHYSRRLIGESSLEYAVVCGSDGSRPKEIFCFTEFGNQAGLGWFRPNGPPAWSPDGRTLAWRISTNAKPTSADEQRELLFIDIAGGIPRRLPLPNIGIQSVSDIEWR